jgi:PAS domain S-box-containing protein
MGKEDHKPKQDKLLRKRAEELLKERSKLIEPFSEDDSEALIHELRVHQIELEMQNDELRSAQLELAESRDRYIELYDYAPVGYVTLTTKNIIVSTNLTLCAMLGIERNSLINQPFSKIISPEDQDTFYFTRGKIFDSKAKQVCELKLLRADGTSFYARLECRLQLDADENITNIRIAIIDITEQKKAEEEKGVLWDQLLQSQKMESLWRLTGGIAHDFNNILAGIIGYAELSLKNIPDDNPSNRMIKTVLESSERAATLVRQLLAFSHKQKLEKRLNNLNIIVDNISKMLHWMLGEDVKLIVNTKTTVNNVRVDTGQIEQVLMNLAVNARHAMPEGGTLTIETKDVQIDKGHPILKAGSYVMLLVTDTGIGISKEDQDKIFEPFFTTKKQGKGTGLGLSVAHGIVLQHDGNIEVHSEKGLGTTLKLYFPAVTGKIEIQEAEEPVTERYGDETILIADDEEVVRLYLADLLTPLGYRVLVSKSGEEALLLSDNEEGKIDLLITDVIMTGMNGLELYDKIIEKRPDIKVIFASGYMDSTDVHKKIHENKLPFINKPFQINAFLRALNKVW